jgi:hypothetical protein
MLWWPALITSPPAYADISSRATGAYPYTAARCRAPRCAGGRDVARVVPSQPHTPPCAQDAAVLGGIVSRYIPLNDISRRRGGGEMRK